MGKFGDRRLIVNRPQRKGCQNAFDVGWGAGSRTDVLDQAIHDPVALLSELQQVVSVARHHPEVQASQGVSIGIGAAVQA